MPVVKQKQCVSSKKIPIQKRDEVRRHAETRGRAAQTHTMVHDGDIRVHARHDHGPMRGQRPPNRAAHLRFRRSVSGVGSFDLFQE